MLLPIEVISTADTINAKAQSLFLSVDQRSSVMWIVELNKRRYAVHLNGAQAGTGFEIWDQTPGYGLQIEPILIRVNAASAAQNGLGWNLQASNNALCIGFHDDRVVSQLWVPVASIKTATKSTTYFSEWSAGVECPEWIELVTCSRHDDLKVNADLIAPVP